MIFAVSNLSLAYYFTGQENYCSAAVNFIDTWFLNADTKMNANSGLEYAQLLRGLDKGRGIGIIDAKDLAFVPDSALLLDGCGSWDQGKKGRLKSWLAEYVTWLSTSAHAADEFSQLNNHGTWFDVQALSLSLHVGNTSWSKFLAKDALSRIEVHYWPSSTLCSLGAPVEQPHQPHMLNERLVCCRCRSSRMARCRRSYLGLGRCTTPGGT